MLPKRSLKSDSELEEAIKTVAKSSDSISKETEKQEVEHQAIKLETTVSSTETDSSSESASKTKKEAPLALIDVTERSHFRPKNNRLQKKYYSGKKKRHTVKNTMISDTKRRVIFLGHTFKGSLHDYNIFKKELPPSQFSFSQVKIAVD